MDLHLLSDVQQQENLTTDIAEHLRQRSVHIHTYICYRLGKAGKRTQASSCEKFGWLEYVH